MSSIAYVTDEKMLEYHRLCRNKAILFWRISSKKKFTDFKKGDLLFFFSRSHMTRKKGLVGYAHFDSVKRLSLTQMWKKYGQFTGYDSFMLLSDAISKAAKGEIPKQMSCLYLEDVVFFLSPIYPEEVGLKIPVNLESYCYLDRSDPRITVNILNKAKDRGIDLWSGNDDAMPEEIFARDEVLHQLAVIHNELGRDSGTDKERKLMYRLSLQQSSLEEWNLIRGSRTDCYKIEKDHIQIALPFAHQANDKDARIREIFGRMTMYRLLADKYRLPKPLQFEVLGKQAEEIKEMVKQLNDGRI